MQTQHPDSPFQIREARPKDAEAIARVHVDAFNETHAPILRNGPPYELRERQWRDAFGRVDEGWFCFVAETASGEIVGFIAGQPYTGGGLPYEGHLKQLYLLSRYLRLGLGRRLVGHLARRFVERGVNSMLLFGEATSAANGFYEHLGAHRLYSPSGEFHGGYGWNDLAALVAQGPVE